jgi:hypothetical protein
MDKKMPTEPRSALLLVRNYAALVQANEQLQVYLSKQSRHTPVNQIETLQGIWIDEDGVANLPCALDLPDASGVRRTVRILEAIGINGVWMLCWLEVAARDVSRGDLVAAILSCFGYEDAIPLEVHFIPVCAATVPDSRLRAELLLLETRFPGLVLKPIQQDANGSLIVPDARENKV